MVARVKKEDAGTVAETAIPAPAFAALEAQAQALEGAAVAPLERQEQEQQAVEVENTCASILGALKMARAAARPRLNWWSEFGEVWSDSTLQEIASAGAEVMALHGLTLGEFMGKWGPYFALAGAVAGPSLVTWDAIQERKAQEERARRERPKPAQD